MDSDREKMPPADDHEAPKAARSHEQVTHKGSEPREPWKARPSEIAGFEVNAALARLWSDDPDAMEIAEALYAPDDSIEEDLPAVQEALAETFLDNLHSRSASMPETASHRRYEVLETVSRILHDVRAAVTVPFVEDRIAVALRPIRRLAGATLTDEVCTTLFDYHRGVWSLHLTKPQLLQIQDTLVKTLVSLPPDEIGAFWDRLRHGDVMMRRAMLLCVDEMCRTHATYHLLRGLERCLSDDCHGVIVDALEQVSDPAALDTLVRLRRLTAGTDWPLSRHIARAIHVIEGQNRHESHRTLLRAASADHDVESEELLRPASDAEALRIEAERLLRPATPPESGE